MNKTIKIIENQNIRNWTEKDYNPEIDYIAENNDEIIIFKEYRKTRSIVRWLLDHKWAHIEFKMLQMIQYISFWLLFWMFIIIILQFVWNSKGSTNISLNNDENVKINKIIELLTPKILTWTTQTTLSTWAIMVENK